MTCNLSCRTASTVWYVAQPKRRRLWELTQHVKAVLAEYRRRALAVQPDLAFDVEEFFKGHDMQVNLGLDHHGAGAIETLRFGEDFLVIAASACHGATG
ncbi:MAG: hypothetical protein AAF636_21200 [Pseudomonadota bacterium]